MTEFVAGTALADRYVLDAIVGQGASASVWRARDNRTQKIVAVKVFKQDEIDERFRQWLTRELKALAVLDHSSIVRMLDTSGADVPEPWIVTEWLEGADLQQLVQTRGPIPERALIAVASAVLSALEAAAALTIVHRDIKPGNIFLCTSGRIVLLDFGVARATGEIAGNTLVSGAGTSIVGTPSFMSPEQVAGQPAHAASDLYSLGVTLRYLLTGMLPFSAPNIMDLLKKISRGEIIPIAEGRAGPDTVRFLDALTATTLGDRLQPAMRAAAEARMVGERLGGVQTSFEEYVRRAFATADEGVTTVQTVMSTVQAPMRDDEAAETSRRTTKPLPVAVIAVGVVLLALVLAWAVIPKRKPPPPIAAGASNIPAPTTVAEAPPPAALPAPVVAEKVPESPPEPPAPPVQKSHVDAPVKKTPAGVQIQLKQWASVEIDGIDYGKKQLSAHFDLEPGAHKIVLKNPSFGSREIAVTLKPGQTRTYNVDLAAQ